MKASSPARIWSLSVTKSCTWVSDVICRGEVPEPVRKSMELWVGCVAGALTEAEMHSLLAQAGFEDVGIEPTRIYEFDDARAFLSGAGLDSEVLAHGPSDHWPLVADLERK